MVRPSSGEPAAKQMAKTAGWFDEANFWRGSDRIGMIGLW
jgi:hypothetical protein